MMSHLIGTSEAIVSRATGLHRGEAGSDLGGHFVQVPAPPVHAASANTQSSAPLFMPQHGSFSTGVTPWATVNNGFVQSSAPPYMPQYVTGQNHGLAWPPVTASPYVHNAPPIGYFQHNAPPLPYPMQPTQGLMQHTYPYMDPHSGQPTGQFNPWQGPNYPPYAPH